VIVLAGKEGDRSGDLVLRQYQEPGKQPKESACGGGGGVGAPFADQINVELSDPLRMATHGVNMGNARQSWATWPASSRSLNG
jgi:hypothetical protein